MSAERCTLGGHRDPTGVDAGAPRCPPSDIHSEDIATHDPETDALGPLDEGAHLPDALLDDPGVRRVGLLFIPAQSTDSPRKMKRRTTTHRIDESDPDSYRRYKQWRASKSYNARNRATRNEKTRERMTMLRARQRLEPPTLQAARLAARQESARKYRENHRELLAAKAAASRAAAKSSRQATSAETSLRMQQRNRLDRALWDIEPTESEQE
ncbi:hypothetical protein DFH08DRAFT_813393 [Mycena albidolilacea]|uniref:Uncharacterized protein n=1 Tax=Mycena albidolilacea TaxID=1033008 RepID=A0AAD6ZRD1_9AGAR|nr:hypothetical protein DFH08DRAFT_813393 [Mycena albidolilacea]